MRYLFAFIGLFSYILANGQENSKYHYKIDDEIFSARKTLGQDSLSFFAHNGYFILFNLHDERIKSSYDDIMRIVDKEGVLDSVLVQTKFGGPPEILRLAFSEDFPFGVAKKVIKYYHELEYDLEIQFNTHPAKKGRYKIFTSKWHEYRKSRSLYIGALSCPYNSNVKYGTSSETIDQLVKSKNKEEFTKILSQHTLKGK